MPPSSKKLAPSVPPSVQAASLALESSLKSFLSRQRKRRIRKQEGGHELTSIEERSLQEQEGAATRAARHGSHILRRLRIKGQALSLGVSALDDCTDQCLAALEHDAAWCDKDNLQRILEHFFTNYLRLRDGLVLLTSGECRHPGDSRQAATAAPEYRSNFGTDSTTRGDGYTALFSAKGGYSGAGWDEFYDENLGVRTRIADACLGCAGAKPVPSKGWGGNRAKVWNRLCEMGAEAFESELDVHETETTATKAQLENSRRRFLDGVNGILFRRSKDGSGSRRGGKFVMLTTDKFERMELQNAAAIGISSLVIERQGDNFCISDESGVLPSGWDEKSWKEAMALPNKLRVSQLTGGPKKANSTRLEKRIPSMELSSAALPKKRRIIVENCESDSDEDDWDVAKEGKNVVKQAETTVTAAGAPAAPVAQSASRGGFRVKVTTVDDASSSPINSDINQIKASLGVDVDALAQGCEEFDAEQKRSASAAVAEEAATATGMHPAAFMSSAVMQDEEESSTINELLESVAQLREEMRACENVLRLVNKSKAEDLWDARESLREVKMTLGICLLELHFIHRGRSSRTTLLFADSLFSDASDLVSHQFNDLEAATTAEDVSTRKLMRQGLFLLRGRAEANRGIVLIALAKFDEDFGNSMDGKTAKNKTSTLLKSVRHLRKASDDARALRAKAALSVSSTSACTSEISKADQHLCDARVLETLATRRHGEALWLLGQWKNGAQKFEEAADFEHDEEEMSSAASSATQLETYLAFLVERYYAATSLVDHATAALEKVPIGKTSTIGEDVKSIAIKGYNFAEYISGTIFNLTEHQAFSHHFEEIKEERDLLSKNELSKAKADLEKWWEEKKSTASSAVNSRSLVRLNSSGVDREYLARSRLPSHPPTTRVVVSATGGKVGNSDRSRKTSQTTQGPNRVSASRSSAVKSSSGSTAGPNRFHGMPSLYGGSANVNSETQIAYRKWGDALLPQIKYPACAPELTMSTRN